MNIKKIITDRTEINAEFEKFNGYGADPTGRLIEGANSATDPQEWSEYGEIEGSPACVYYTFTEEEVFEEDASNYAWDADHVSKIEIGEIKGE
jgi:hypothetical protein